MQKTYEGREKIIEGFKNGIFPLNCDDEFEEARQEEEEKTLETKMVSLIIISLKD